MLRMPSGLATKGLAALVLLLSLGAAACGSSTPSAPSASVRGAYPPLNLHLNADRYEFTTPQSMCPSVLTSYVVVGSHGQARWNTANGQRPLIASANTIVTQGYRIYTPVLFSRNQPLIDHRTAPTRQFMTIGGQVGPDSITVEDSFPQLRDGGQYVIVFAPDSLPTGQGKTADWLVVYDAFPVDAQGMVLLQAAGSPNELGPGQPQPAIKLSLTSLEQQLAACK